MKPERIAELEAEFAKPTPKFSEVFIEQENQMVLQDIETKSYSDLKPLKCSTGNWRFISASTKGIQNFILYYDTEAFDDVEHFITSISYEKRNFKTTSGIFYIGNYSEIPNKIKKEDDIKIDIDTSRFKKPDNYYDYKNFIKNSYITNKGFKVYNKKLIASLSGDGAGSYKICKIKSGTKIIGIAINFTKKDITKKDLF